jgi:hypothetical protein
MRFPMDEKSSKHLIDDHFNKKSMDNYPAVAIF